MNQLDPLELVDALESSGVPVVIIGGYAVNFHGFFGSLRDYIRRQHLMRLVTHAGYVDLFDFVPGYPQVPVDDLFATAVVCGRMRFVSLEWLKKMKLAARRPQDCIDLENLP